MGLGSRTPVCVIVLVLAALVSLSFTEASAQSRVCRNLQAQLSAIPRGGGGGSAAAVAQLKRDLVQARRTANQKRCGALFGERSAECKALNASIQSMTGKLASLQGGGGGAEKKRQQLQAALRSNGCNKPQSSKKPQKTKQAAKPKPQAAKPKATAARSDSTPKSTSKSSSKSQPKAKRSSQKTFRTMCVRMCDGYYFPISFSVPEKLFDRDAETCQARCPGTEVSLYVHKPGEESENMISYRDDEPYRELDTAFSYRRTRARENSCGCSPAPGDSEQASNIPEPSMEETGAIIPIPTPSPARRESQRDGESVDVENETGTGRIQQAAAGPVAPPSLAEERRVRVVGPKFLPDPSEVIDLRDPDRLPVR